VLLVLGVAVSGCGGSDGQDTLVPRTDGSPAASSAVHDGDRVAATGRVVQVPGSRVKLCAPVPVAGVGWAPGQEPAPAMCDEGVWLEGADLATLANRREKEGAVEGQAHIVGVFRDGTIQVEEQSTPQQSEPRSYHVTVPCPAPPGGWPTDPSIVSRDAAAPEGDVNMDRERPALEEYRAAHPDQFVDILYLRPSPDAVLLGVLARDDQAKQAIEDGLRPTYKQRLCVTVSRFTQQQLADADADLGAMNDQRRAQGVYGSGHGISEEMELELGLDVVMLTDELVHDAAKYPPGLVRLTPWLTRA
jgi:hypothetical protein